jgi:uncharacterized protein YukE
MSPDYMEVAADRLISYAERRFEDSYAYHALAGFVLDIGAVPRWAWSTLPWSDDWRKGWEEACENRLTEAKTIRDEVATTGGKLAQVAADYTETDLDIAVDINLTNDDVVPYLDYYTRNVPDAATRPGGGGPHPDFPDHLPPPPEVPSDPGVGLWGPRYGPGAVPVPRGNDRLQGLREEAQPRGGPQYWIGRDLRTGEPTSGATFHGYEQDELEQFVQEHGSTLVGIESSVSGLDPGGPRPWSGLVKPAWLTCPSIIQNRAELMGSAANTYRELSDSMSNETQSLHDYWSGSAAPQAYFRHAEAIQEYLADIEGKATNLAGEGERAANALTLLRNAYAAIGYQHIRQMIDRMEEHIAVTTSAIGRITECSTPTGAANALVETVLAFNTALAEEQRRRLDAAAAVLPAEAIAVANAPDFGSEFDPEPFPPNELNPYSAWDDGSDWRPSPPEGG